MKKLLAMLLSLVMVFSLVTVAAADDADFTLVIEGGEVYENEDLLSVEVALNGTVQETLLTLTFGLTYDPELITFVSIDKDDAFNSFAVNDTVPGELRISLTSEGVQIGENAPVITMQFQIAEGLEVGTEIAFELQKGAVAETFTDDASVVTPHDIAADFSPYVIAETPLRTGFVVFNEGEVLYRGETPYVIWDHAAGKHEPAFTVYDEDGVTVVDPENYDYEYKENMQPGTGYLFVYFKGAYTGEAELFFKIYLPATTNTTVENVADGIRVTWAPVEDAAGYVIYRRAWSSTTNGWTAFARWDNTTETTYLDGHDEAHKVFAGTRYQYGVKAYFARRTDPVSGEQIGGNVNNDSGNFNLGIVGPLKTTVRITTRKLLSVEAGKKQMTVKWERSKNFTGYQIQYAEDANFKTNSKNYKIDNWEIGEDIIKNLTSGKTYYVRIRSYHLYEGMNYYGEWSEVMSCKVK
jgi:hypothetical protein